MIPTVKASNIFCRMFVPFRDGNNCLSTWGFAPVGHCSPGFNVSRRWRQELLRILDQFYLVRRQVIEFVDGGVDGGFLDVAFACPEIAVVSSLTMICHKRLLLRVFFRQFDWIRRLLQIHQFFHATGDIVCFSHLPEFFVRASSMLAAMDFAASDPSGCSFLSFSQ